MIEVLALDFYSPTFDLLFLSFQDVVVHSLFLVVEIFVGILLVFACLNRREGARTDAISAGTTVESTTPDTYSAVESSKDMHLKRRHSHEEKGTNLGRSQIEELKKRRSSLDRK